MISGVIISEVSLKIYGKNMPEPSISESVESKIIKKIRGNNYLFKSLRTAIVISISRALLRKSYFSITHKFYTVDAQRGVEKLSMYLSMRIQIKIFNSDFRKESSVISRDINKN